MSGSGRSSQLINVGLQPKFLCFSPGSLARREGPGLDAMSQDTAASFSQPIYFGSAESPLLGWVHIPSSPRDPCVGLVLCSPFGYEEVSAHRALRSLATDVANAGMPVLRYDHAGTGDSAGDAFCPELPRAWLEGIRAAMESLGTLTGVRRFALAGVRLGATLALCAADTDPAVCGVLALAPVVNLSSYLRELRALAASSTRPTAAHPPADGLD
jgi:alpha-beta hydrolase superfamily lysophospholipase